MVQKKSKKAGRPFQTAGAKLDDVLGDASKRIEEETKTLIAYINNELVPAIREHSSTGLRIASEKLKQAADMMDAGKTEKGLTTRVPLLIFVAAALLLLSACGGHKTARAHPVPPPPTVAPTQPAPPASSEANAKPAPVPRSAKPIYVETGLASWYGPPYHHHRGANGEIYDQNAHDRGASHAAHELRGARDQPDHRTCGGGAHHRSRAVRRRPHYRLVAGGGQGGGCLAAGHGGSESRGAVGAGADRRRRPLVRADWRIPKRARSPQAEREAARPLRRRQCHPVHRAHGRVGAAAPSRRRQTQGRKKSPARPT